MNLNNKSNNYVDAMGLELFGAIPKTVLAAIAVSALTCGGDQLESAARRIALEWEILHGNGIVPQKPTACARNLAAQARAKNEWM